MTEQIHRTTTEQTEQTEQRRPRRSRTTRTHPFRGVRCSVGLFGVRRVRWGRGGTARSGVPQAENRGPSVEWLTPWTPENCARRKTDRL
jgi:hypothetical protein